MKQPHSYPKTGNPGWLRHVLTASVPLLCASTAMAAPTCDVPEDIVEWMHHKTIAEIAEAWPWHLRDGPLWEAFQAALQGTATTEQQDLVEACVGPGPKQ